MVKSPWGALFIVLISLSVKLCDLQGPLCFLNLKKTILQWKKIKIKKKEEKIFIKLKLFQPEPEALIAYYFPLCETWSKSWCGESLNIAVPREYTHH